jgi:hypothetical protein
MTAGLPFTEWYDLISRLVDVPDAERWKMLATYFDK